MAQRHLERKIKDSHFKTRNRDEDRRAMGAPSKGKAKGKGKETAKNNSERGDCRWITKANVILEIPAHSSMTRTRMAKGRDDLVHLLRQVHRTEIRKVTEKVVMTEAQKAHQNFLVRLPCTNCKKWTYQKGKLIHVCIAMFPNVKNQRSRWMQIRRQVCIQTHSKNLLMKRNFSIDCCSRSTEWCATDANTENSVGWHDPILSETWSSREQVRSEMWKLETYTWSHPDHIQESTKSGAPTFEERSVKWTLSMEEKARTSAWIIHKNVYQVPGSYCENRNGFFNPSPASDVSSPSGPTSTQSGLRELDFICWELTPG